VTTATAHVQAQAARTWSRVEGNKNQRAFDLIGDHDFDNPLRQSLADLQCSISEAIRVAGTVFAGDERRDERVRRDVGISVGDPKLAEENLRAILKRANCKAQGIPLASSLGVRLPFECLQDPDETTHHLMSRRPWPDNYLQRWVVADEWDLHPSPQSAIRSFLLANSGHPNEPPPRLDEAVSGCPDIFAFRPAELDPISPTPSATASRLLLAG
jgi:hypothetical protein